MNKKHFLFLLKYELINTLTNFYTIFFGMIFPTLMGTILVFVFSSQIPDIVERQQVLTTISLTMSMITPLCIMLISFASSYSLEIEKNIIFRLQLFQISTQKLLAIKILVHYFVLIISLIIFSCSMIFQKALPLPTLNSAIVYLIMFFVVATICFIYAFAIANIFKKSTIANAVAMGTYFFLMIVSGMMGIQPNQLPEPLRSVAFMQPLSYVATDFHKYWEKGFAGYNFAPFIQSCITIAAIAGILYLISLQLNRKKH
jgi:ABC-2 type transporter.